ncbi:hypothetical protein BOTBODRAFT_379927 [Botryobasidium botryosum FD-172 SS1]|uniref:Uncharacterized protein n=1 Tax=Botryobasidium botryosum (strain FD-172 SS1) TaxID=930990 RepID=A0A067MYV8_BOTB1|nr:hypothetical protein BOTBODRAFT_379927 [Botryobasidium botryosum FD-172 SS1]
MPRPRPPLPPPPLSGTRAPAGSSSTLAGRSKNTFSKNRIDRDRVTPTRGPLRILLGQICVSEQSFPRLKRIKTKSVSKKQNRYEAR